MVAFVPSTAVVGDASSATIGADIDGSVQNPAWSPDGSRLVVTVWRGGYNVGPADLVIIDLATGAARTLVADGLDNVNMPGTSWSAVNGEITFSSTADPHDEIWTVAADGTTAPRRLTLHDDAMAYEPTWGPDADVVVYEVHPLDVEGDGRIARSPIDGDGVTNVTGEEFLTPEGEDCRQPVWAPADDLIVFQCTTDGGESWTLFVSDPDGDDRRPLATRGLDATDASFSADGTWIVFSGSDDGGLADLWAVHVDGDELVQLTDDPGYEGAPSWSPDGTRIAFERSDDDPDGAATTIGIIDVDPAVVG
jgi:TolB protein